MGLLPGARIGGYEVRELLGVGGMGEVYRGYDVDLQREVAIKVMPRAGTEGIEQRARFAREAQILASLSHPHIAAIYGLEHTGSADALILELVDGPTLSQLIADHALSTDDALRIARQIACAVRAAHERGVIHRDLKPSNVKLTSTGEVKVLDFGLAKECQPEPAERHHAHVSTHTAVTEAGVVLGTTGYMAPEQVRGHPAGKAADVWAFGCILFEMLSGERPFDGTTTSDTFVAVLTREPDLDRLANDTPASVRRLVRRCLEKDPERRLHDLGDACLELNDAVERVQEAEEQAHAARMPGERRTFWTVIACAALAAAALLGWYAAPRSTASPVVRKFQLQIVGLPTVAIAPPRISPDGSRIAYVADDRLWVRDLTKLASRPVFDEAPTMFFWSYDGTQIGFAVGDRLMRVSTDGGEPVLVAVLPGHFGASGFGGAWTHDGRIVISQAGSGTGLLVVPDRGGELSPFVAAPERADLRHPSPLPSGGVLYTLHENGNVNVVAAFKDGVVRELVRMRRELLQYPVYSASGHLLFERGGSSPGIWAMAFNPYALTTSGNPFLVVPGGGAPSVADDGTLTYVPREDVAATLAWIRRDGTVARVVSEPQPSLSLPSVAPDGNRILAVIENPGTSSHVAVFDGNRQVHWRVTTGDAAEAAPFWLDGGRTVGLTLLAPKRPPRIISQAADGSGPTTVLAENASWGEATEDGRQIVFSRRTQSGPWEADLWRSERPGTTEAPVSTEPGLELAPRLSPDGRMLAYLGTSAGSFDLFVRRFPTGEGKWQVSFRSCAAMRWSQDSERLYYVENPGRLMQVDISAGPPVTIGTPRPALSREPQDLHLMGGFDVSADGSEFLVIRYVAIGRPPSIVVVQNWMAEFAADQ